MKKIIYPIYFGIIFFTITSCDGIKLDQVDPLPECDFSGSTTFTMTDFNLALPEIQSNNVAFINAFNMDPYSDNIIYNLNTLLETKGDYRYSENEAAVYGKLTSTENCTGEKEFEYKAGNSNVMINSVSVPAPVTYQFGGDVVIKSKTDSFREQGSGYNQGFYVRWEVSENNADNFVEGNLDGEKIRFDWDEDMMYIPEVEEPIYIDGNYGLPSEPTDP